MPDLYPIFYKRETIREADGSVKMNIDTAIKEVASTYYEMPDNAQDGDPIVQDRYGENNTIGHWKANEPFFANLEIISQEDSPIYMKSHHFALYDGNTHTNYFLDHRLFKKMLPDVIIQNGVIQGMFTIKKFYNYYSITSA